MSLSLRHWLADWSVLETDRRQLRDCRAKRCGADHWDLKKIFRLFDSALQYIREGTLPRHHVLLRTYMAGGRHTKPRSLAFTTQAEDGAKGQEHPSENVQ